MELFRQWGIADDVRSKAVPGERAQGFGWMTRLNGLELGRLMFTDEVDMAGPMAEPGPEFPCFCPQPVYEEILRRAVGSHPSVLLEFERDVESLDQDESFVRLGVRHTDGDETETIHASYVVAADGAVSSTRARLGIHETGTERFGHSVNVHFRADLSSYVHDKPFMLIWIINGETQGTLGTASQDQTRWTYNFDAQPEVEYREEELVSEVRRAVGVEDLSVEVLDVLRWDYEQAVSDRWRAGRVLLAGDAAHRFPPHGAFGMNSGVQDANNLAWKLIQVVRGTAGQALLDTYEAERKPVAERNSQVALANTRALAATDGHGMKQEDLEAIESSVEGNEVRERIAGAVSEQRAHLHSEGQQFGTIYGSGAVVSDGTEPVESTVSEYRETAGPGARAPHVWLRRSSGERLSTLDLWDDGFVLLTDARGAEWLAAASSVAQRFGIKLTSYRIGSDSELVDDGRPWAQTYGVTDGGAVLVRPDGHVGARFPQLPQNPNASLEETILRILHLGVRQPLTKQGVDR
jgi:2-polyprenyl-6-methoxyphenol hydroxylase-like FAD-dependent oxidoreductase